MRKLAVFTGNFALGIFLAQYLLPYHWLLPCGIVAFLLACGRLFLKEEQGRRILLMGVGLSLAFGYHWLYVRQVQKPMEAMAGNTQMITMTLCDYAIPANFGAKATAQVENFPGKIVYYGDANLLDLQPGQTVSNTVYFQNASRIRDDDVTSFTSKGVFLLAYGQGEEEIGAGNADGLRWWPVRMGYAMRERIRELFEGDTAGFLIAILTGDKSGLSEQRATDLSEAGLYHILAVSGMHCGFLLVLVNGIIGRHRRRLVAVVAIPLLLFYAVLTGGSPSVLRACVMLTFLLAAPLFQRDSDGPTAMAAALFLILLKNPFAVASISLQLSFGAMAGILWLTPRLYQMLMGCKKHGRLFYFTVAGFSTTMGALVFTIPLSAYYFGFLVLLSPLSNLLCLWVAGMVFMLGLVSVLASFVFMPLGVALAVLPRLFTGYIFGIAHGLATIPYHAVYFVNPYLKYWLAFAYVLFAVAYIMKPKGRRKYAVAAGASALTLAVTITLGAARYNGNLDMLVLNVGQGQSILMASEGQYALVDCGSANSWYDPGGIAADYLLTMGCRELNYLILTHYDADHVNGVESLLARLKVNILLVPVGGGSLEEEIRELAEKYNVMVCDVDTVENLTFGEAVLTIFPPVGKTEDNERGLSILETLAETEVLITGDMDAATERKLMAAYDLPDIEYLIAGHHGSKYSTSGDLLDTLAPETVCISTGNNPYGHPAEDTLRRLAERGCVVYRTDLHGCIHLSLHQGD